MVRQHHFARIEPPRERCRSPGARGHRDMAQQHAGVDGEVVDALLGLFDQVSRITSQVRSSAAPPTFSSAW